MTERNAKAVAMAGLYLLMGLFAAALVMGVWWLLWSLWTWVMPQAWPTGPEGFIRPGYWLFAGMWTLLVLVGQLFKGKAK